MRGRSNESVRDRKERGRAHWWRPKDLKTQVSRNETWGTLNLSSTLIPGQPAIRNLRLLCEDCHKFRHGWFGWVEKRTAPLNGWSVFEVRKKIPNEAAINYLKLGDIHFHIQVLPNGKVKKIKNDPSHFRTRVRPHWKLERTLECGCIIEVRQYLRPPYYAVHYRYPDILALCVRHRPKSKSNWPAASDVMPQERWRTLRPKRISASDEWEAIRKRLSILAVANQ